MPESTDPAPRPIDPGADIGHVHLEVADIDRALDFYRGVLGSELTQRFGSEAAFLAAGGYHHHIGFDTWESRGSGASDHGVSEAVYLADPDGNGLELYWDRPREAWPTPRAGEKVAMYTRPLDLEALLAAAARG